MVEAFLGVCVHNLPNHEKVRAASRMFNWKPLTKDQATLFGPANPNTKFEGWLVNDTTGRYVVGISEGQLDSKQVVSCALASTEFRPVQLVSELRQKLDLRYLNDEREAGQRYQAWTTSANGYSIMIMLTSMQSDDALGGSLSASVKVQ